MVNRNISAGIASTPMMSKRIIIVIFAFVVWNVQRGSQHSRRKPRDRSTWNRSTIPARCRIAWDAFGYHAGEMLLFATSLLAAGWFNTE
jgi:hypothetical protein